MRLILLGTAGGPRPSLHRAAPAQAIVHGEQVHIVDCGNGVAHQAVRAGLSLHQLRGIYITHHHADHILDLGALPLTAWTDGRSEQMAIYGPTGTQDAVRGFLAMMAGELSARTATTGRTPFPDLLSVTDLAGGGQVQDEGGLRVTTTMVNHPPFEVALAYRFDTAERSIVISGDTTYSENLIELARGADVLVHEALYEPALAEQLRGSGASTLRDHLLACHTSAPDVGRVAQAAGVKTLVLSHLVPHHASVTDQMWAAAASEHFDGEVVVGRDLMEIR